MQELNKSLENQLPMPDTKAQEQKASQEQQNASEQLQKKTIKRTRLNLRKKPRSKWSK